MDIDIVEVNSTTVRPVVLGSNALEIAFGIQFGPRKVSEVPKVGYFLKKFPHLYESVRVLMTGAGGRFKSFEEVVQDLNTRWIDPEHYFGVDRRVESFSRARFGRPRNIVVQRWFRVGRKSPECKHMHTVNRVIFPNWKDRHHRLSRRCGGEEGRNLSYVPRSQHMAYHILFDKDSKPELPIDLSRRVGLIYACMKTIFSVDGLIRPYEDQLRLFNGIWAPGGHSFKRGGLIEIK